MTTPVSTSVQTETFQTDATMAPPLIEPLDQHVGGRKYCCKGA